MKNQLLNKITKLHTTIEATIAGPAATSKKLMQSGFESEISFYTNRNTVYVTDLNLFYNNIKLYKHLSAGSILT